MDIDHFKKINDAYGHDVGDRVLRFAADTMVRNSRPFDLLARWGGEEFLGLIRNITARPLEDLGERLRRLVAQSYIPVPGGELHATVSIGATVIGEDDTIDSVIKRADALLYESKKGGRNRLTLG